MRKSFWLLLLAFALLDPGVLIAQESYELRGRVVDAGSGAPVAGVIVEVVSVRGASARSGADGRWRIGAVPAGSYRLRAAHIGFSRAEAPVLVPAAVGELEIALSATALPLDAVVVTASRRAQRLADAPVTTELITRREIEQARVSDLSTLLTERLGIQLEGGHPAGEGVMLQGLGSERVLVLIDGQPVVGRVGGMIDLSRIPSSMVERVEVVKGAQSALFGSDAMGGVVNIITRAAPDQGWTGGVDATAGTQGRGDVAGRLGGALGPAWLRVDAGRRHTELTPGRVGQAGALAGRWDGALKLGWSASESLSLQASAVVLDERQRWRDGALYHFSDNRQTAARVGAEWASGAHRLAPVLYLSRFEHLSRRATAPEPVAGAGDPEEQRLLEGELLYNGVFGRHALDLGVEAKREGITSARVQGHERVLHTVEPFAQATWALGGLQVVPGARLVWSEQWGSHLTPRLSTLFRPVPALALRASAGRGFRAPSFKELGMEFLNTGPGFGYVVRGNEALRPETSTSLSLGSEWTAGRSYVRLQAFRNRFQDFIETRLVGDSSGITVHTYDNIDDGFTRGVELEGGIVLGRLRAEAGYGYLQAEDAATGEPLLGRPAHSGRASLEYPLPLGFGGTLSGVYTGETPVQRGGSAEVITREGFLRIDLRLSRPLPGGLDLALGARNLLDTQPADWPGYARRHLYLGIGWAPAAPARSPHPNR